MGIFSSSKSKSQLVWNDFSDVKQLADLMELSHQKPVLIFKHSTRCSISGMSKNRLELYWETAAGIEPYYLDLLNHRNISDEIAKRFNVRHESPQVLLLKNGACIFNASHNEIDFNKLKTWV
jgi:bacillithiol system protein YtxJ